MYQDTNLPPPDTGRLAQFMRLVEAFERDEIEAGVDLLIEALDKRDGDPDLEDSERGGEMMVAPGEDYDPSVEMLARPDGLPGDPDDGEDDDPAGGDIVDEPHDEEEDVGADEAGEGGSWPEGASGGVHAYADDEQEDDGVTLRRQHRDRIRRTRCEKHMVGSRGGEWPEYRLKFGSRIGGRVLAGWRFEVMPA